MFPYLSFLLQFYYHTFVDLRNAMLYEFQFFEKIDSIQNIMDNVEIFQCFSI